MERAAQWGCQPPCGLPLAAVAHVQTVTGTLDQLEQCRLRYGAVQVSMQLLQGAIVNVERGYGNM